MDTGGFRARPSPDSPLLGIGFQVLPWILQVDEVSEFIGLRNRCLKACSPPKLGFWDSMPLVDFRCAVDGEYGLWNARWSLGKRQRHDVARDSLSSYCLSTPDFIRSAFVKRELSMPDPTRKNREKDPRIIQGVSDRSNVALGPWMWAFSKLLARKWSWRKNVAYASGMTPEDVGRWFDYQVDRLPGCCAIECDLSRMDSTVSKEAIAYERRVYLKHGLDGEALVAFDGQARTIGVSVYGYKYKVLATRKTGDPNTSCGNSMLMGVVVDRFMKGSSQWASLIMGDDVVILASQTVSISALVSICRDAGFVAVPKKHLNPRDASFCSQRFWPTADGTVLGPKVGRLLCKIGFAIDRADARVHMRGVILGLKNCMSFVPLLRSYAWHILRLTSGVKATPKFHYLKNATSEHESTDHTVECFDRWYGPHNEQVFDSQLAEIRSLPASIHFEGLEDLIEADA